MNRDMATKPTSELAQLVSASLRRPEAGENPYRVILRQVRQRLTATSDPYELAHPTPATRMKVETLTRQIITDYRLAQPVQGLPVLDISDEEVVQRVVSDVLGFGPLDSLLRDEAVEEIIVNGTDIWVIDESGKHRAPGNVGDPESLVELINRLVATTGRQVNLSNPILDAQLPDGSRLNATISPVATPSPAMTIRRHRLVARQMQDLIALESLTESAAAFLAAAIRARLGILVAGGTSSGKTNFLNVLAGIFPEAERVVVIEDTRELQLPIADVVYQSVRYANAEGTGEITQRRLVQNALRMRPDRIVIGEVRGAEALDMLLAANTGHEGFLSTVHANSAGQALTRLVQLTKLAPEGSQIDEKTVAEWITEAFHLVVFLRRDPFSGKRRVEEIIELTGSVEQGNRILNQPIFSQDADRRTLVRTPYPLARADRLRDRGVDPTAFAPMPRAMGAPESWARRS
ncbi:MAG: Flp pilus assembly complex ATPase component TadA [Chloroflexi bacterium]|nr:Flp pilus assembly complex ATPase component TadA [Chloroflexota bacterium]